jgi:orotidine-5'-phosphate decarboxylase
LIDRADTLGNPTVVGLDPTAALVPLPVREHYYNDTGRTPEALCAAFLRYNKTIIDAVADVVPAVKPQIAMYEYLGPEGVAAYAATCEYAASKGLLVIGDVKRGDISSTAAAYASHLAGADIEGEHHDVWREDFITVNPYLGSDGIRPFTDACAETGKGIFVLVKTSNPSSGELQDIVIDGEPLYMRVARLVSEWGAALTGERGYSSVGAVVGATHRDVGAKLRAAFPQMFFLVPGYGAQGAGAEDVRAFFDADGRGCIVNSSRGIIGAWTKMKGGSDGAKNLSVSEALTLVSESARDAALRMKNELGCHER